MGYDFGNPLAPADFPRPSNSICSSKDRTEHVEKLIGPALDAGKIVILDRYFYSSIAYQGSRGANVAEVKEIMESRFPIPDAVFLLDIDPILSVHRIAHSRQEEPN